MNTATKIYFKESVDDDPEYLIPDKLRFESLNDSKSIYSVDENSISTQFNAGQFSDLPKVGLATPLLTQLKGKYKLLQLWEGRVMKLEKSQFEAIITDKTNPEFPDELVTIDNSDVMPDDIPLLLEGAIFYWSIGYLDYPGRGRARESKIRFRRLRGWGKTEIERAKRVGKQFANFFKTDSVCST